MKEADTHGRKRGLLGMEGNVRVNCSELEILLLGRCAVYLR